MSGGAGGMTVMGGGAPAGGANQGGTGPLGGGAAGVGVAGANMGGNSAEGGAGGSGVGGAEVGGSGVGGGGAGGGGSSGDFQPCPTDGSVCKILPLGDSITDGIGTGVRGGGYRVHLFELAVGDGKNITFVGGSSNGPSGDVAGMTFPTNHEGHSGWTIEQIDGITPDPALGPEPHIVLLHIGTNDMYQTPAGAPDRLGELIDQILETLPDSLLVVSNIIPFPGGSGPTGTYNDAVPGVVQERIDAGAHILFAEQFEDFPESELSDGVHPNNDGYDRMAQRWYDVIQSYLP